MSEERGSSIISYRCPQCGNNLSIPREFSGQAGQCKKCGSAITVPSMPVEESAAKIPAGESQSFRRPGYVFWLLVLICPLGGVVCTALMPKSHPQRKLGLIISSVWLAFFLLSFRGESLGQVVGMLVAPICLVSLFGLVKPDKFQEVVPIRWTRLTGVCVFVTSLFLIGVLNEPDKDSDLEEQASGTPGTSRIEQTPNATPSALPTLTLLTETFTEDYGKTMVLQDVLIAGHITEENLETLLLKKYDSIMKRGGFKYHKTPTVVGIYAFSSKEHADSGMAQWMAMLSMTPPEGNEPQITIDDRYIASLGTKPEVRLGLSENRRVEIWNELIRAEDQSQVEAEAAYPGDPTQAMTPGTTFTLSKQTAIRAQKDYADPWEGMKALQQLPAGTTIKVVAVDGIDYLKQYYVAVQGGGNGWILGIALINQSNVDVHEQLTKQYKLQDELNAEYDNEIAARHSLTKEHLAEISVEGFTKGWAFPNPNEQDVAFQKRPEEEPSQAWRLAEHLVEGWKLGEVQEYTGSKGSRTKFISGPKGEMSTYEWEFEDGLVLACNFVAAELDSWEVYNPTQIQATPQENRSLRAPASTRHRVTWNQVARWRGNGIKNTETFTIPENEWRINWRTLPGEIGDMNFQIFVYTGSGELKGVAANIIGAGQDVSYHRGAGEHYLTINSGQDFIVSVEARY